MISVVVPAHDEAAVVESCLRALVTGAQPGELEVVVVCNGCRDDTAERARSFGSPVRVVELAGPSKVDALNRGDVEATGFPRFYVDADVVLPLASLRKVAAALDSGRFLAAAPGVRVDTSASGPVVRSYHRIWERLPAVADDLVGRGVYAVGETGRARFGRFPDLVADDQFVRATFTRAERGSVEGSWATVRAPRSLRGLLRRRARVQAGNVEMARHAVVDSPPTHVRDLFAVVRSEPSRLLDLPAFLLVTALVRGAARARHRQASPGWARDDSRPVASVER